MQDTSDSLLNRASNDPCCKTGLRFSHILIAYFSFSQGSHKLESSTDALVRRTFIPRVKNAIGCGVPQHRTHDRLILTLNAPPTPSLSRAVLCFSAWSLLSRSRAGGLVSPDQPVVLSQCWPTAARSGAVHHCTLPPPSPPAYVNQSYYGGAAAAAAAAGPRALGR